jgi:hypothetical protein
MARGILQMMKTLRVSGVDVGAHGLSHKRTYCTLLAHLASHAFKMVCLGLVRVGGPDAVA